MAYIGLDATQHERTIGDGGNSPLPNGLYTGVITRAQLKDNSAQAKDPNGKYLECEFDITHPPEFNRRKLWEKFNLINKSGDTVRIAKEQLADLTKALGMTTLNDSDDLMGKEVTMILEVVPARPKQGGGEWPAGNKVLKFLPVGATIADYEAWLGAKRADKKGQAPERKAWGAAAPAAAPATATPGAKPWGKK